MKDKMDIGKFKASSAADIGAKVVELKRDIMNARFALSAGNLKDTSSVGKAKKAVARLNTYASANAKKGVK
ncbi:MAG: 50S ribosomal protein L29 [Rickettsiales bacterium]|jgi:ribosomal protein L29|nr:50S ribosomal protein L29 [Rickettsiales bacterium]